MSLFIALIAISSTLLIFYLKYMHAYWRRRGIPHETPHFLLGNLKGLGKTKHLVELFNPIYEKFKGTGPYAGFYFSLVPTIVSLDLDFIKTVLVKDFNNFDTRGLYHNVRDDPLTGNLVFIDGPKWRRLRQKLTPTFTSGKMKHMFSTVVKTGAEFRKVVAEQLAVAGESELELTNLLGRYTADVIGTCAFGLECNCLRDPDSEFVKMGRRALSEKAHGNSVELFIHSFPSLALKLRLRSTPKDLEDFYLGIVRETVAYREKHQIKRNDFMDMLIEMKSADGKPQEGKLSFEELAAQAFIFLFAGFETSSTTMAFALYELAKNPDVQDKLRQEVNEVFKRHNNEFTYECMLDLCYLEQVILETLRKYPVLPQLVRKSKERYVTDDPKYIIEAATTITIPVHAIHYDPELYPEPEKFNPDRFTEEEIRKRHTCAYLPFGDGPRNCIGMRFGKMQVCIGLAYLIRDFQFMPSEHQSKVEFNNENMMLSPKGGIHLVVKKI